MKILVALHPVMDLGGIINHTEQLIGGLKEEGHEVDLKEFLWANHAQAQRREGNFLVGPSGIPHAQGKGWNFERRHRVPYRGTASLLGARQILSEYEMVIWTVPVPSKNKHNLGNGDWPELYQVVDKQVAIVHDGNSENGYPHLLHVQDYLTGVACVHHCALNSASFLGVPRTLILNPQHDPVREVNDWNLKRPGFVNMQTFKAWKHAHELIEAIAYMQPKEGDELREVAGKGIEYQYMTSENKCKPAYFHGEVKSLMKPELEPFSGQKFWDAALANGMTHHDYWSDPEVNEWLKRARVLVDPSWSERYSKIGGHYNRVVVDAMIRGAIPVAHRKGMGDELFRAGVHYVEIPDEADPLEYASVVERAGRMSREEAGRYREAARELLPLFDRRKIAREIVALAHGDIVTQTGSAHPLTKRRSDDILFSHFGII